MDQNEAVLQDTKVGFLEKEAEPVNFLTLGDISEVSEKNSTDASIRI